MPAPPLSRRQLLRAATASGLCALGPAGRAAAASVGPTDRRFLFVQVSGGWDPTRVFAPAFGASGVSMEADAVPATTGDLEWVDHPDRPSVRAFFERWIEGTAVINGVYVPAVSHSGAYRLMLTSVVDAVTADWPTRIAATHADDHLVPHLVAGGKCFAGKYGVHVGRTGDDGQLGGLADGTILARSASPVAAPDPGAAGLVDAWLATEAARAETSVTGPRADALASYRISLDRARALKELGDAVDLSGGDLFGDQVTLALAALSSGLSRCVTISHPLAGSSQQWDSHTDNDAEQSPLFEDFFGELDALLDALARTPGAAGATLADETVVVVLSEMGRTPFLNDRQGKDHWPYTSAMLVGEGIAGGRAYGGYDDLLGAVRIDLASGELDEGGSVVGTDVLGSTLLALAGLDPGEQGLDADPLTAVIA